MELREWALSILAGPTLEEKLFDPGQVSDLQPGPAYFFDEPARATQLRFTRRRSRSKLPSFQQQGELSARLACLHRFCGHELLAVELLAFAALAFPHAPSAYRKSLIHHLREEQAHVRLYRGRLLQLGSDLGDQPLYRHFWATTGYLHSLRHFIAYMNLTIEQANLDFAPLYLASFLRHEDRESARVMATILQDEIGHVRLGLYWHKQLHAPETGASATASELYESWSSLLPRLSGPKRALGFVCHRAPRVAAGMPQLWIDQLCRSAQQVTTPLAKLLSTEP